MIRQVPKANRSSDYRGLELRGIHFDFVASATDVIGAGGRISEYISDFYS